MEVFYFWKSVLFVAVVTKAHPAITHCFDKCDSCYSCLHLMLITILGFHELLKKTTSPPWVTQHTRWEWVIFDSIDFLCSTYVLNHVLSTLQKYFYCVDFSVFISNIHFGLLSFYVVLLLFIINPFNLLLKWKLKTGKKIWVIWCIILNG